MIDNTAINGKYILLLYEKFFGYDVTVKKKLEESGAKVDLYDVRADINTVEKAILKFNDVLYLKKQRKFHSEIINKNAQKKYDFIFANNKVDIEVLKKYRKTFPDAKIILYLNDSVKNIKGVEKTFSYFDKVLTFDRSDAEKYSIVFRPLFFSDLFTQKKNEKTPETTDICFVGTCHSDRLSIIKRIKEKYSSYNYFLYCYLQSWFMYYYYRLTDSEYRTVKKDFFKYTAMPLSDVVNELAKSKAILDMQHPLQTGLTMRTVETIGMGKKIITTNTDIANYDFFDKNNILIIDRENPEIPEDFIYGQYKDLPDEIYEKYSISGWIKDVF